MVKTELGEVQVRLGTLLGNGLRPIVYDGPAEAVSYVHSLVYNLTRLEGRLLGDECTAEELSEALTKGPLSNLVSRVTSGHGTNG